MTTRIVEGIRFLLSAIRQRQPEAKIKVIGILPRRNQEERVRNLNLRIRQIAETGWYTFKNRVRSCFRRRQDKRILILRRITPEREAINESWTRSPIKR